MTSGSIAALLASMSVLALVPSVSVLTVTARAASAGFLHGAFTAMGIVLADILFILLAVFGLALLAEAMGDAFGLVRYASGAYLILLGFTLWRARRTGSRARETEASSLLSSFMAGLLVTLGDQKAVLFYLGFLPAFVDLSRISHADIGIIIGITIVAVGGVKLGYAYAADRLGIVAGPKAGEAMNILAAGVMIATGCFLIATAG